MWRLLLNRTRFGMHYRLTFTGDWDHTCVPVAITSHVTPLCQITVRCDRFPDSLLMRGKVTKVAGLEA